MPVLPTSVPAPTLPDAAVLLEDLLRAKADLANTRARGPLERDRAREAGRAEALRELLRPLDELRRSLAQVSADDPVGSLPAFLEAVQLVAAEFDRALARLGVEAIPAEGLFDPAVHEAVERRETTEAPGDSILEVRRPGYRLRETILRPAQVVVAAAPRPEPPEAPEEAPTPTAT